MANQITDNRTLIDAADSATGYVDLSGGAAGTLDTEIFIEGTGSVGQYLSSSLDGLMFNFGTATDVSSNVFYIRVNCGIVGLLDTQANGGFRIRFCGATVSDFFEVYVGGNDSWPAALSGGWVTFVVDIEDAHTAAVVNGDPGTGTGGTPPATTAIQYFGWAGITGGTMPRMVDNTWMDASYRLPDGNPGVIIEGQNGGTTDWTFEDIFTQLGVSAGVFVPAEAGGGFVCNTPIQVGVADGTAHGFADTGALVLWADQQWAPADLYGISVIAGAGGATFDLGVKNGTGDPATGSQGVTIAAGSDQVRWFLDAGDVNITGVGLYGCNFTHGSDFTLNQSTIETISCTFVDCSSALVANSLFQRNTVVGANTADGVAFASTDDLTDVRFCSFQFSDGHAVELTTPLDTSQESRGNLFSGYGSIGTNDAAIFNNTGGDVTINVTNTGDTPTYRNGTSASTTVQNTVTVTVVTRDLEGNDLENVRVLMEADSGGDLPSEESVTITRSGSTATVSHTAHGIPDGTDVAIRGADQTEYNGIKTISVIGVNSYSFTVSGTPTTPATGTITSSAVILTGLTDSSGTIATAAFAFTSNQPVKGVARDGPPAPIFKDGLITGTITASGLSLVVSMASDES